MLDDIFKKREFFLIAGPCVIENMEVLEETAFTLNELCKQYGIIYVFKCSYDKANRTSLSSYRGLGLQDGIKALSYIKEKYNVPITTDVHDIEEVALVKDVVDIIQIPAFLCRQTDLLLAASNTGKPVNVKKGQFLAPWDMKNVLEKLTVTGNNHIIITERGTTFGYNNLVVDFRAFPIMRSFGYPVMFDVTHSLQLPGGHGSTSGGQSMFAPAMARAATAVGVDGLFMEVHPMPEKALCDGPNMVKLTDVESILFDVTSIRNSVKK
ncbi:MAG: 3-deoxy-8-phosphooctulonate synthase [Candidatus Magnetoovum sp. WYHC-5]|nr:3-deoxy-8-phosphooctulonate synthase [Candidatus Magnetoovum sp. WYHC-5]